MAGKIVILGAGLAGLSAAYHLKGEYEIFEKDSRVGGLARSERIDGFTFDYTGHLLFLKSPYTKKLIEKLLGDNLKIQRRNSWVYSKGIYIPYPFQANLYGLPKGVIKDCLLGLIETKQARKSPANFEEWVYSNFGKGFAKHFFTPYNQKLWLTKLRDLSHRWAERFIPKPTIGQVLDGALGVSKQDFGYNVQFYYPLRGGIEVLPKSFLSHIKPVNLNCQAVKISSAKKLVGFDNGQEILYDRLISTLPLPELIKLLDRVPDGVREATDNLRYVSVLNINLGIDRANISDRHWIYFPEVDFIFYRVGFTSNFSPHMAPEGKSSIYTEISYSPKEPVDRDKALARVIKDLIEARIIDSAREISVRQILDLKYAYVIMDHNHEEALRIIQKFLRTNNIHSIGRYGGWDYLSMEDSILAARQAAQEIKGER